MPFLPLDELEPEYYQAPRMDKMSPNFVQAFEPMAKEFYETTGRPLRVTDTFRTYDEQADLKRRKPYLAARPGTSRHELGEAMDIHQEDVSDVEKLGLLNKYGFHRPVMNKGETWHIEINPNASNMVAGPGATKGSSFIPLDKLDSMEKLAPAQSGFVPLSDLQDESISQPSQEIIPNITKNVLQPEQIEFNPNAEPSQKAGEAIKTGIEKTQEYAFWPLNKAITWTHRNLIEPVRQRDITSQAGAEIPAPGQAAPEAFAPLPEEKTFVPAMEFALAPSYFKLLGRTAEVLGKFGKQGFYKYAPDWMFRQGEAGLPEVLPPERISEILGGMSGEERAVAARKYPEFRDILTEWQMGGNVPETAIPTEPTIPGISEIARPAVTGELMEPQAKLPPGQGFIVKPPTILRKGTPPPSPEPDYYYPPEELGGGLRVPPEQVGIVPEVQNVVPAPPLKSISDEAIKFKPSWDNIKERAQYKSINGYELAFVHPSSKNPTELQVSIFDNAGPISDFQIPDDENTIQKIKDNGYIPIDYQKIVVTGGLGKPSENYGGFGWKPIAPRLTNVWIGPKEHASWMQTRLESGGYSTELKDIPIIERVKTISPEPIPTEENVAPEVPQPAIKKPKTLTDKRLSAIDQGNIPYLIKLHGGFNSQADIIKKNFPLEERRKLFPYTRKGAQGPDALLDELKNTYPDLFPYETDAEFLRAIIDKSFAKPFDAEKAAAEYYAELEENERLAESEGIDKETLTRAYGEAQANLDAEREFVGAKPENIPSEGQKLSKEEIDNFWNDLETKKYYAGLPATEFLNYIGSKLPTAATDLKYPAKVIVGSKLGAYSRRYETFDNQTKKFLTLMDKEGVGNKNIPLTENPGMQLASDLSTGRPLAGWKGVYATIRQKAYQERLNLLDAENVPLENVKENYFPGMWTRPSRLAFNQAVGEWIEKNGPPPNGDLFLLGDAEVKAIHDRVKELIASKEGIDKSALGYISKRPFKGKESFRKPKFFADDIMDAVRFGLEPISTNPIVLDRLKMAEIDRNILAYQSINELKNKGMLQFNPVTAQIPEGKAKIDDPFGTVFAPPSPDVYGRTIVGHWIADQPVADVLNNYLSNTLYNNRYVGKPFTAYMFLGNMLNQFQLGMGSFFHGGFTSLETQITSGAEVIKDIYGVARGNRSLADLAGTIKEFPLSIGLTPYRGYKLMQEWLSEAVDLPTDVPVKDLFAQHGDNPYPILAKAAELAGAGFKQEKGLQTEQSEQIIRDWYGGGKIKAALRSPIALSELLAKPLMQYWVPAQKAGVFAELAGKLFKMYPDKTLEELMPELRQKWNRVDARLGQVRYNRLFIHNYGKNIVQALVRAPGWSGGTIAEVGGAPKDAIEFVNEWQKSGKAPDQIPDRVAYLISLLGITAMVNGLLTYAFTGDMPQGMDWWAFRDGGHDTQGRPTRFFIPTYAKDLLSYYKRPVHTILAKMHPIIGLFNDIYKGTDYFNNQFRNPQDGWLQQGFDTGKYILKQYKPFWVRNVEQSSKGVGGLNAVTKTIISNIGVAPAPGKLSNSPDMDVVDAYLERFGTRVKSKEEAAKMELKRTFKEVGMQQGADEFRKKLDEAVKNGEITKKEMQRMLKESKTKPDLFRFNRVPLEVQIQAYKVAPPERQAILKPLVIKKYGRAEPEVKRKFRDEFRQIMNRSQ